MTGEPWRAAWERALYGPGGFYLREAPRDHFRTSAVASPRLLAAAVRRLAERVDAALGRPDPFDVVDLGAGRGELLHALPDVPARWRLVAVERAPDPGTGLTWVADLPETSGLLLAHEWLDVVPLDVLDGDRLVLVGRDGAEALGPVADPAARAWARRWWPGGGRVEAGLSRDRAWAGAVGRVRRGLAVAVDYGHLLRPGVGADPDGAGEDAPELLRPGVGADPDAAGEDAPELLRPGAGAAPDAAGEDARGWEGRPGATGFGGRRPTLTGYRAGRQVPPVPDGSCDLTAHVALDSCAAATGSRLLRQREALRALGVDGSLPVWDGDGARYAAALRDATQAAQLLDPAGLGGFGWLVRAVGIADPLADVAAAGPATMGR